MPQLVLRALFELVTVGDFYARSSSLEVLTTGPTTTWGLKDNMAGQHPREVPNQHTMGPTTTRAAWWQHEAPNDDTAGVNANAKGQMTVPQAQRQHGRPNAELGAQGGDSEQSLALLLFLCVVFYLVHVPRHQGGSTPSLYNIYIFL
jgi:hypothetical protein